MSSKKFQDSLIITKPKSISLIDTLHDTLEMLFETQISLPSEDTVESRRINRFSRWLGTVITNMNFPEKTYKTSYSFNKSVVDKKFPYVFLKDSFPYLGIDYLSFTPNTVINNTKLKSFDINIIRNSQSAKKRTLSSFQHKIKMK